LDDEFIQRMEEILDLYKLPYNRREPVVCLDEKPVQLLTSKRKGIAMGPGYLAVQDYEYVRRGTANIFCGVDRLPVVTSSKQLQTERDLLLPTCSERSLNNTHESTSFTSWWIT